MADNFKIVSQRQSLQINPGGTGFINMWEVTYQVTAGKSKGTVATVTVPDDEHDAEHVSAAILDKVAQLDAVAGL